MAEVVKESDGSLTMHLKNGNVMSYLQHTYIHTLYVTNITTNTLLGQVYAGFDCLLAAIGRYPLSGRLGLDSVSVKTDKNGYIVVDDYQNTSAAGVFAIGDVCGKVELTPMAIAAGRRLADRY